jgi:serine/threonine protein kinase
MGVVYMAEQTEPVQRKVALKLIKPGMDTRQVIARFEAERQALALMDHVNIARVLDAGATEHGRPYFVMELVHGVPITKYCDDNRLTPLQRLELFVPVCQAIQHAHQKGIIHRDIKPSNVMVTLYDGKPVPKVIDFGVAKAAEQKLTERTLFTQYGTMAGDGTFGPPVPVGGGGRAMAVGDLNGDGKADLVFTGYQYINAGEGADAVGYVQVLLGNGDGTFADPWTDWNVGTDPASVALADLNGDGDLDVVTGETYYSAQAVYVLLGNGDGTLAPLTSCGHFFSAAAEAMRRILVEEKFARINSNSLPSKQNGL